MWWTWLIILILIIVIAVFLFIQVKIHHTIFEPKKKHVFNPNKKYSKYVHGNNTDYTYQNVWLPLDTIDGSHHYMDCHPNSIKRHNDEKIKHSKFIHAWHFKIHKKPQKESIHFPKSQRSTKTVLFLHGNTGNISYRDYVIDICHKFKLNLLLIDYRGYGKSDGACSVTGVYNDTLTAYYYLRKLGISYKNIIVWGESLGGAPAAYVASKVPCDKLILFSTFSNLPDLMSYCPEPNKLATTMSSYIDYITTPIPTKTRLTKVKCPVMIIHSEEDDLIGYQCARNMYYAIKHPRKHILTIKGAHSAPKLKQKHLETLLTFCTIDSGLEKEEDLSYTLNQLEIIANKYQERTKRHS